MARVLAAIVVDVIAFWIATFAFYAIGFGALTVVLSAVVGAGAGIWYRRSHRGWNDVN